MSIIYIKKHKKLMKKTSINIIKNVNLFHVIYQFYVIKNVNLYYIKYQFYIVKNVNI